MAERRRRQRRIDYPRRGRTGPRRWLPSWRQQLSGLLLGAGLFVGLFAAVYVSVEIPDENAEARRQATVYYWADGSQMVSVGAVDRQNVELSQIPDSVESAVISAENESFYTDSGVSVTGIARAVVSMAGGGEVQGGSTITQQYVKNTYLSQDQTAERKLKEFFISLKLDNSKSKREILQGYLNSSWFGRGAYGIQAASNAYYGIPAKDLNPSQGAMLASLLKGAEEYDPADGAANHQRAVARWSWILDRQVKAGAMSAEQRAKYRSYPEPRKISKPTSLSGQTGYLVDIANKYIKKRSGLTDEDLARGDYRVHTTFEKDKVRRLEKAVRQVRERDLDPKKRAKDRHVEVGAATVRPADGAMTAAYGGADATKHFANNADTSGVPVGSAFKPFVLAAALQHGPRSGSSQVSLDSYYDEHNRLISGGPQLRPATPAGKKYEPPTTLRESLLTSANATFVQLGKDTGLKTVRDLAVASGLREESMARLDRTFPLGTSTPSAVRMAGAYTTFTNGGTRADPYSVTRVVRGGAPVDGFAKPRVQRVMDTSVARDVSDALRFASWRMIDQESVKSLGDVTAGGTSTDDRMKSAWFIGHTGDETTAITLFRTKPGTPQLLPMQGVGGADSERGNNLPPRIWAAYATSE
ncbi:transglycosylase domain-containing protein [Streptomyces sp. H27-D2]|uniref:transglycosylase domain-containing protein n=1 Tax=Streptomyces sp. H27-D2 TaxID=3046304 RepID=UPI002DBE762C|nr:transglycosylase domain-containing protein [Streptomyces sp. H27-D2]MEC4017254.1 transglycosylase domain-containing protein [Streptomyces sp. H27-D2]